MGLQPAFRDLLVLFNEYKVRYMMVGGYAFAYHGVPGYTGAIDIYVKPDPQNAERIMEVLNEFGFGSAGLAVDDFEDSDKAIQPGVPRVDIITSISGVAWQDAYSGWVDGKYGEVPVKFIGLNEFILNKRTTGRKKDLSDLEAPGKD